MSGWLDISQPISESMVCWPGRVPPERRWEKRLTEGHHCNVSSWNIGAHSGTHIDAPLHFFDDGCSIDEISPDIFMGECTVVDLSKPGIAGFDIEMAKKIPHPERVIVRTHHSDLRPGDTYAEHDALMSEEVARYLTEKGLKLLGTDRLSVDDSAGRSFALHKLLLNSKCPIVEGLLLSQVTPGSYHLCALPLRLEGGEASPARVMLKISRPDSRQTVKLETQHSYDNGGSSKSVEY